MDLYATILEYTGIENETQEELIPSRSLMPIIKGEVPPDWGDDAVFSEQEETRVVRTQQWALFKRFKGPNNRGIGDELYDVLNDVEETNNLSGNPEYAEIELSLNAMLDSFFEQHVRREADLWNGGVPIQNSIRQGFWRESWGENWEPVYSYEKSES